jgi:uncharacterized membrane protein
MHLKKRDLIAMGTTVLSLAGLAALYRKLPASIPTHWNLSGRVDGWSPRWSIFAQGALPLGLYLLMRLIPRIDPRSESHAQHERAYGVLSLTVSLGFIPIAWISAAAALGADIDSGALVRVAIGVMFAVIGNFLGKLRSNYFIGIRTPWTLADDEVWRKTHRRGGAVFVAAGLLTAATAFVPSPVAGSLIGFGAILGASAYVTLYSYLEFRKLGKKRT